MVATIVNHAWYSGTSGVPNYALEWTPTIGNRLLVFRADRGDWVTGTPRPVQVNDISGDEFEVLEDYGGDAPSPGGGSAYWDSGTAVYLRTIDGSETAVHFTGATSGGFHAVIVEVAEESGVPVTVASAISSAIEAGVSATGPAVATPRVSLVFGWLEQGVDREVPTDLDAGSGWTVLHSETIEDPDVFKPHPIAVYKTASTGTTAPVATSDLASGGWTAITVAFVDAAVAGVYADWDGDGFGVPGSDDDLTADVQSWTITRGAAAEITGGAEPGSAVVVLNNRADDRYNPLNPSGPLYGKLRDGVPFWTGVNADGAQRGDTPRGQFGGRIKDITPILESGADIAPTVEITCEDALGWLGRTPARLADALFRTQGQIRTALLTAAGETRVDLPHEITSVPISSWDGSALAGLEALDAANGTRHFIRPADDMNLWYDYVARNRQWRLDGTVDATMDGNDTGSDGWRLSADTVINQQKATVTPITFTSGTVTVWEAPTLPIAVTSTASYETWVEFDDYVDDPVVDVNYTGTAPSVTLLAFGATAQLLIASAGSTSITGLSIEGALLRRGQAESAVVDDLTSQAGPRGVRAGAEISGEFVGVLASANGIAAHVVWRYATPQYRPTLTVEDWLPEMLVVDLYDVIAVTIAQLGVSARHFEVVGLEVAWLKEMWLPRIKYVLQECRVQSDPGWFVIGTSLIGGTDVLAY